MTIYRYPIATKVQKKTGYAYPGVIVAVFNKLNGEIRYVVECTIPEVEGMLHIFSEKDLELRESARTTIDKKSWEVIKNAFGELAYKKVEVSVPGCKKYNFPLWKLLLLIVPLGILLCTWTILTINNIFHYD